MNGITRSLLNAYTQANNQVLMAKAQIEQAEVAVKAGSEVINDVIKYMESIPETAELAEIMELDDRELIMAVLNRFEFPFGKESDLNLPGINHGYSGGIKEVANRIKRALENGEAITPEEFTQSAQALLGWVDSKLYAKIQVQQNAPTLTAEPVDPYANIDLAEQLLRTRLAGLAGKNLQMSTFHPAPYNQQMVNPLNNPGGFQNVW